MTVLAKSKIPPAASMFAKRTNGLVMASIGRIFVRGASISSAMDLLYINAGLGANCNFCQFAAQSKVSTLVSVETRVTTKMFG
jgi:hypothetical protein